MTRDEDPGAKNEDVKKKRYLAHGTGAKEHRKRRVAFQSSLDNPQFSFPGEKAGQTCSRVLNAQSRRLAFLGNLFTCFLEQALGFRQRTRSLGGLDGSWTVQSAFIKVDNAAQAYIQEDTEYFAHAKKISTVEIHTERC